MVNRWMSKRWLCCKVSTASSTIPMSCRYPAEVRQSQILPAGRHPQLSSTTAAESLNIFKQISQFSTRSSHQGWDALQTPLQSVAAAGGSLFIIWMLFFLIFQMICIYIYFLNTAAVHQRTNTVWLSPDTKTRASVERRAARWHPWWGLWLSWRRLKPPRAEPPVRVRSSHTSIITQLVFLATQVSPFLCELGLNLIDLFDFCLQGAALRGPWWA